MIMFCESSKMMVPQIKAVEIMVVKPLNPMRLKFHTNSRIKTTAEIIADAFYKPLAP
jgi:hypothetical protein